MTTAPIVTPHLEIVKPFLIVGEKIEAVAEVMEWETVNVLISSFLTLMVTVSVFQSTVSSIWSIPAALFLFFLVYYIWRLRIQKLLVVTNVRIIKVEINPIHKRIFSSHSFNRYHDLHFSHISSIRIGEPKFENSRFWMSLLALSLAWLLINEQGLIPFLRGDSPLLPLGILLFAYGFVNLLVSIPLSSYKMKIESFSGSELSFSLNKVPSKFIETFLDACRKYQSYGGI